MQKINFQNLPSTATPINATNLNAIQTNVEDVFNGNVAMGDINTGDITVGGKLYTSNYGREDYADFGYTYDGGGNMGHKRSNVGDQFQIKAYNGTATVGVIPETGYVYITGNLNIGGIIENKVMGSTNLNDIKISGTYTYDNGSQGYTNAPTQDGIHILHVINNGGTDWLIQEDYVLRYGAGFTEKYIRQYSPGGWSGWQKII